MPQTAPSPQAGTLKRLKSPALTVVITDIYDENWLLEVEAIAAA